MSRLRGHLIDTVVALLGVVVGLVVASYFFAPSAPDFDSTEVCHDDRVASLFDGMVADAVVVAKPNAWFAGYSAARGFDVEALHSGGVVFVDEQACAEGIGLDILAHELAHALDFFNDYMSDDLVFPVTGLGHSVHVEHPNRELFAFCVASMVAEVDYRQECPEGNMTVAVEALEKISEKFGKDG